MRKLYYDTVLYTEEALRLLIKTSALTLPIGTDALASDLPVDSCKRPFHGQTSKPMIENIEWLRRGGSQEDSRGQRQGGVQLS